MHRLVNLKGFNPQIPEVREFHVTKNEVDYEEKFSLELHQPVRRPVYIEALTPQGLIAIQHAPRLQTFVDQSSGDVAYPEQPQGLH